MQPQTMQSKSTGPN